MGGGGEESERRERERGKGTDEGVSTEGDDGRAGAARRRVVVGKCSPAAASRLGRSDRETEHTQINQSASQSVSQSVSLQSLSQSLSGCLALHRGGWESVSGQQQPSNPASPSNNNNQEAAGKEPDGLTPTETRCCGPVGGTVPLARDSQTTAGVRVGPASSDWPTTPPSCRLATRATATGRHRPTHWEALGSLVEGMGGQQHRLGAATYIIQPQIPQNKLKATVLREGKIPRMPSHSR
ncbi:hypothetical protein B0J11DRAFT_300222 [Dendryphion nanum]|uniref:Uncharacterized protein n=1 Tax=Dendryphion nanum TaxID=256645 RepID=A0A9P9DTZ4_9PLEO|nr:hypothetical protein B0J11DRAFT_300222 [Dendryphion nanum]